MMDVKPEKRKRIKKTIVLIATLLVILLGAGIISMLTSSPVLRADDVGPDASPVELEDAKKGVIVSAESFTGVDWGAGGEKIIDYEGSAPTSSVSFLPGDRIHLRIDYEVDPDYAYSTIEYFVTRNFLSEIGTGTVWNELAGDGYVSLAGYGTSGYVYFRIANRSGSRDVYSTPAVFAFSIKGTSSQRIEGIDAFVFPNADPDDKTLDVNDKLLIKDEILDALDANSSIFYTTGDSSISFVALSTLADAGTLMKLKDKYIGNETVHIVTKALAIADGITDATATSQYCYVRLNGIWYRNDSDVALYNRTTGITVDTSIRVRNQFILRLMVYNPESGMGNPSLVTIAHKLKRQLGGITITPDTVGNTGVEDVRIISIDQTISFSNHPSNSEDCTILYTFSRNVPSFDVVQDPATQEYSVVPTGQSHIYNSTFTLDDTVANYGANCYITVIVVYVDEETGSLVAASSTPQTFTYFIQDQPVVSEVHSTPSTSADSITEVKVGDVVILHCDTQNVEIFYTIDGTEPLITDAGEPGSDSTFQYNASQGVVVPVMNDTVFTITAVAYRAGLATSDIARMTFQFPSAVSAPYAVPTGGTVTENTPVVLRTATEGALIRYTIGYGGQVPADPTASSAVFSESTPILIDQQTTIKAVAVSDGTSSSVNTFHYFVYGKLSVPVPSIGTGSVVSKGTVVNLSAGENTTIYYTTDGSNPKDSANKAVFVGNTVVIDGEPGAVVTVKAYANAANASGSEIGAYNYTISNFEGGVFADKDTDSVVEQNASVILTTDVTSGTIYYTLDGTMPTIGSASGRVVTITGEPGTRVTLKAAAISSGSSQITTAATYNYTIMPRLKSVKSTVPTGAVFTEPTYVTLSADSGSIYYTVNGENPTATATMYQNPILVDHAMTIKAMVVQEGSSNSEISTFVYGFADQVSQPECSHSSGELEINTEITFTCGTPGAQLYYTTNGVDPDVSQMDRLQLYTGPLAVTRATTYKVVAVKDRMQSSAILTVGFTVKEKVVIEQEQTGVAGIEETSSGRLKSRRTYDSGAAGPEYTDIILRNVNYGASVSAESDTIPQTAVLQVERTNVTDSAKALIKQRLSDVYEVVTSYDITLWDDSVQIQPNGEIEIGLPIPAEYENAIVYVAYVGEDGVVELPTVRRYSGIAYVKTDHLSVYSIVVPSIVEESNAGFWIRIIAVIAAVTLLVLGRWLIIRQRKKEQEDAAW